MGQAIQQFRRAMSLRSDPGRLSLETGLTGTALWLTFLYLMQDGAVAADAEGVLSPDTRPGAGAAASTGTAPTAAFAGGGGGEGGARSGGEPGTATAGGARHGLAPGDPPGPESAAKGGLSLSGQATPAAMPATWVLEGPLSESRSQAAASSGLPWTGSPGAVRGQQRSVTSEPSDLPSDPASDPASDPPSDVPGDGSGRPVLASPVAPPAIPTLRVVVRSDASIVSRSVEGEAHSRHRQSLDAIRDAVIDLRDIRTPRVQVGSDRELTLLALSVLDDADLNLATHTTAMNRARLQLGPEANDIRLRVSDAIDLALVSGGLARGQVLQSLIGMLNSHLEDAGGGGTLELSSLGRLQFQSPVSAAKRQIGIDLLTQAMQDSAILLGDGDDRVLIASGFLDPQGGAPGLLITVPASAGPSETDASLQLRARALGLVNSRLEVGGGDDVVSIRTWLDQTSLDPTWPAVTQRIALLDSDVDLGEGDDRLSVEGAVTGSRIAAGPGTNRLDFDGAVTGSTLTLAADSSNAVGLGEGDDTLTLRLAGDAPAQLALAAAGGDDRIDAPLARLVGSIDGGGGFDTLVEAPGADGAAMGHPVVAVHLEDPGSGTIGSLHFISWENLFLGDGDDLVTVGATGRLNGMLEGSGGLDGLDYGAWQEPVVVDLGHGEASGILGGISGFETVRTGAGDDWIMTAAGTRHLETGAGDDRFELDLGSLEDGSGVGAPPLVVSGGEGRDRFVLAGMEAIRMRAQAHDRALPVLADLAWSPGGGIGLTDAIAWRLGGLLADRAGEPAPVDLTPSGLEGIGQPRLLPIAPLDQLVSGMGTRPAGMDQLAIATGDLGSRLVLLGSDRSVTAIAELPALRSLDAGSAAAAVPGGNAAA